MRNNENICHNIWHLPKEARSLLHFYFIWPFFNPLNANPAKWSNTLKQFVGNLPTNCLSVFEHFVKLALNRLTLRTKWLMNNIFTKKCFFLTLVSLMEKFEHYLLLMAFKRCFNYTWHCIISQKSKSVTASYLKDLLKTFCDINRQGHNYFLPIFIFITPLRGEC